MPVLVLAILWLAFELAIFRDASFAKPWWYVAIMFALGAIYLAFLLITRGGSSALKMPDMISIDAVLDSDRGEQFQS
ncbi:hypothetical protein [Rubellimicrobium aerolatum]|uniref:Uncharacterized protein n=1 Tax=Rubellimicrobium aerolatum TaxID=490979 RepID=A0ABW0SF58_9RHOB|nr:hypothetical protein [Rubellimicrobium aerolatum]MBP1806937.1 RsiW-degrading membrane proteinase PrsW (M82 family) [Rubellimicrobium aerolatum]